MKKLFAIALVATLSQTAFAGEVPPTPSTHTPDNSASVPEASSAAAFAACGAELSIGPDGRGVLVVSKCDLARAKPQK